MTEVLNDRSQKPRSRGFSTRYEDHVGLLHKLARGQYAILQPYNPSLEYEDIFQEMSLTYVLALETYKPELGITFSAYLGRAALNNFGKVRHKLITERSNLGMYSIDEHEDEDGNNRILENCCDSTESIEQQIIERDEVVQMVRQIRGKGKGGTKLSRLALVLLGDLIDPSDVIRAAWFAKRHHARKAAAINPESEEAMDFPDEITLAFCARLRGVPQENLAIVRRELNLFFGKTIFSIRSIVDERNNHQTDRSLLRDAEHLQHNESNLRSVRAPV